MVAIHNQHAFDRHVWRPYRVYRRPTATLQVNWARISVLCGLVVFWSAVGVAAFRLL